MKVHDSATWLSRHIVEDGCHQVCLSSQNPVKSLEDLICVIIDGMTMMSVTRKLSAFKAFQSPRQVKTSSRLLEGKHLPNVWRKFNCNLLMNIRCVPPKLSIINAPTWSVVGKLSRPKPLETRIYCNCSTSEKLFTFPFSWKYQNFSRRTRGGWIFHASRGGSQ